MSKIFKLLAIFFIAVGIFLFFQNIQAKEKTNLIYFYRENCLHCLNVKPLLEDLQERYSDQIQFHWFEVAESEYNRELFYKFLDVYGIPQGEGGVPLVFISNKAILGDKSIIRDLEPAIEDCLKTRCSLKENLDKIIEKGSLDPSGIEDRYSKLNPGLVIGTALVDSLNPCAIAVLIFLIGFILATRVSKKRLLLIGLVYILTIYLTYFLAGLGLLRFIEIFNLGNIIIWLAALILILAGLINIKDFFWKSRGISLKIPEKTKPLIERFLTKATIPAVIIGGFLVTAFELPCTGEVYLGILSLIAKEGLYLKGYLYLLLYNFIFVLPLLVILILSVWELDIQKLKSWQKEKRRWARLIIGFLMIGFGILLIFISTS